MIRKVVIPAAGLGVRLLPATKEQPKEMLPFFSKCSDGQLCLKPMLQLVFEELYEVGLRDFCFIIGRGKRSIEDHFTIDTAFLDYLETKNEMAARTELKEFYCKLERSNIAFVNQPSARGFGDAVYQARPFTAGAPFLVHAGDDLILSKNNEHIDGLITTFDEYGADAALCVERVKDPKKYGVVVGKHLTDKIIEVRDIIEKPSSPPSDIAAVGVYVFNVKIFRAIEETDPDERNEIQLTDAIRNMIRAGSRVYAVKLSQSQRRVDIGTPASYRTALKITFSTSP